MMSIPQGLPCKEKLHTQFRGRISATETPRQGALRHVDIGKFVDELKSAGVSLFTGVPDSLLKRFCACVTDNCGKNHIIAAHDSVGGQPKVGGVISLPIIAAACGYNESGHPTFKMILVAKGARKDLGRPKEPLQVNKALYK